LVENKVKVWSEDRENLELLEQVIPTVEFTNPQAVNQIRIGCCISSRLSRANLRCAACMNEPDDATRRREGIGLSCLTPFSRGQVHRQMERQNQSVQIVLDTPDKE